MEFWVVTIGAVVVGAAVLYAWRQRQAMVRIRDALGPVPQHDSTAAIRSLQEQRDRSEAEIRALLHDRTVFLESLGQGVLVVDDGLRIERANAASHDLLGKAAGSLPERSLIEAFLDPSVEGTVRAALEGGSSTGEIAVAGADGPRLVIRARRRPSGGAWLILEDVSELRRLQQIRAEFIDNLSHELRTPLTTVSLLTETLTREAEAAGDAVPARMRDRIAKIEVETGHLVQMVSELMDLSRIESGGALGVVDLVDLGVVATETVERLRLFADRQDVELKVSVDGPIPSVWGDADRLAQVMVNLVHNAVKFSPDGGQVSVTVHASVEDVIVAVADHGVGIPRAAQARIFERFYKVDRARVRGDAGGTGLGLAISRHIVDQHGGRIWVESQEGVGSTFSFSLPLAEAAG